MADITSTTSPEGQTRKNYGHIELEGLPNTRDLGGIPAAGGKQVQSRRLIRSGALADATKSDLDILINTYQLRMVIDLRMQSEREQRPDPENSLPQVRFEVAPLLGSSAAGVTREGGQEGMKRMLETLCNNPEQVMMHTYATMATDEQSCAGLAHFFELLLENEEGSTLWHCSIGKDRVGLSTALLLYALGASREDIFKDYEATNLFVGDEASDLAAMLSQYNLPKEMNAGISIINSADPRYLQTSFDVIEKQYGSLDAFLGEELKLSSEKIERLRELYLE